jgi:hypothetical protein
LRSYALLPQILQACGLSFATSAAPGFASPFFGFGTEERSERGGRELAAFWLSLQDRLRPELLSVIDARSPTALFESVAHALVMRLGATLPERVDQLVQLLLAVPFGALDDAKFSAVERALLRLEGHAKGSLLMTLVQRLEAQPVPGAHSLWILRLLGDPAALAALSPSERAPVLLRFFKALPGELLRILPQLLDASLSTDLVNALCSALNAFAFSAARLPAGFAALAEDVLRVGLSPDEVVPDERGQGTLVTALALIQELLERREQAGDLARLAVQLADGVVAEASWFAAHLLALAKVLKQLRGGVPASPRRSIYFLLHTSCAQTYNERYAVQGLLDALIFAHGNGRSPEGAGQILDALQVALSEEDQLWIPMMRQCLFPTLSGRTHGSTH